MVGCYGIRLPGGRRARANTCCAHHKSSCHVRGPGEVTAPGPPPPIAGPVSLEGGGGLGTRPLPCPSPWGWGGGGHTLVPVFALSFAGRRWLAAPETAEGIYRVLDSAPGSPAAGRRSPLSSPASSSSKRAPEPHAPRSPGCLVTESGLSKAAADRTQGGRSARPGLVRAPLNLMCRELSPASRPLPPWAAQSTCSLNHGVGAIPPLWLRYEGWVRSR